MSSRRIPRIPRPSLESLVQRVDAQPPGEVGGDTVPTGFPSVDKLLGGGLRRRDLVVLGGDIGAGKSARALGIEGRVAIDELRLAPMNDQARAGIGAAAVRLRGLPFAMLPLAAPSLD